MKLDKLEYLFLSLFRERAKGGEKPGLLLIAWTGRWGKRDALFYQIVYRYVKVIG